jgi:hypothetical protein
MKITVLGALALVGLVIAAVLLLSYLGKRNDQGPKQNPI